MRFIKQQEAYFIISSISKTYSNWGHHDLYVFPEFQLGTNNKVDYLITGKNSFGFHFMFVELEAIYNSITIEDGSFGGAIRKGLNQVESWQIWLERNYNHLKPIFEKSINPNERLPDEFFQFDSTKVSYAVICGRRKDYQDITYRKRGNYKNKNILILHYDNVIDCANLLLGEEGFR